MRIPNNAAAKRAGVTPKTLSRWDQRYEEVGYPKPIYILGRIYRETDGVDGIDEWEANNPNFSPSRKSKPPTLYRTKQAKRTKVKDKAEHERAIARRDKRQQALPVIGKEDTK